MPWPFRKRADKKPHDLRRSFVTPEGVDLRLELGGAGARAAAFLLDAVFMLIVLIVASIAIGLLAVAAKSQLMVILWLLGFFVLRNGWFILFEIGGRGATPGKMALGLRVVARDGAPLTGGAVIARNAMREIEVFLPLSFLGYQASQDAADAFLAIFALLWTGIFLLFPLLNRDRLRVGDLVGGTWVVRTSRTRLADDIGAAETIARVRRSFSDAALNLYGVYELQTLEEVLRLGRPEALATVAAAVRRKADIADDGDDLGFLTDYYRALCARLERGMMLGRRRDNKYT
ncbi:MAG TPA: RDD family protein [Sphingomonas sp.]|uniref:RDD family protein n=1 Tax=Sphingomonas sp. TaxID=28214 RepID=UPI002BDF41A8|nr:RDD family protein [Sphingomonas sp.]HMI19028.1 RDD family protein [Sphingomonas sp.]